MGKVASFSVVHIWPWSSQIADKKRRALDSETAEEKVTQERRRILFDEIISNLVCLIFLNLGSGNFNYLKEGDNLC